MPARLAVALFAACLLALAASSARAAEPVRVVTTISQITDLVRNVAGDRAEVQGLMGEGVDPHGYVLTRSDTARLLRADVIFYNGHHLEGKILETLQQASRAGKAVVALAETFPEGDLIEPVEGSGLHDPHVWGDPRLWARAVEAARDALIAEDPAGAETYRAAAERYVASIRRVDDYATRVLASVPESSRVLITAHDAFNYFGSRFGFDVIGIQGISTESEAGVRDIERLVDLLVDREIRAVFIETTVADRNVRALIEGAAARGHEVVIGGALYSDAMGAPGTYEGTYVGMVDHNATVIARALGGQAPAGGMQGRLTHAGAHSEQDQD